MKIACLILVHKNTDQLQELIELLECDEIHFYIHIDKNVYDDLFKYCIGKQNIFLIKNREKIKWATYSLVQATINGLKQIISTDNYDYINFISGQDLPIKNKLALIKYLEEYKGYEFMTSMPYTTKNKWWIENENRVFKYNFQNWNIPFKYRIQKIVNRITKSRKSPKGYIITGNSQWFCITTDCAKYILKTIDTNKKLIKFFKYVWGADEFLFSTIVYNSSFKDKLRDNLTYVDWETKHDGHPKIMKMEDYEKIMNSDKLFARKFDKNIDGNIIEKIKQKIKNV
jgi:hypothetical protein